MRESNKKQGGSRDGAGRHPFSFKTKNINIRVKGEDYIKNRLSESETYEEYFVRMYKEVKQLLKK